MDPIIRKSRLISIHTPAKGVTGRVSGACAYGLISIHTPAKGVTKKSRCMQSDGKDFNPHSREGSDVPVSYDITHNHISIHTPAKGVTAYGIDFSYGMLNFNPHSREGSDSSPVPAIISSSNFNPHSREGSDTTAFPSPGKSIISIHTPAKGVTFCASVVYPDGNISIHTPAKGVTAILPNFRLYIL